MTVHLLAGGGTAGHVNPLLATADRLRIEDPDAEILVLGTAEGLEARLVPERGYELVTIPRLPFPRRIDGGVLRFPGLWRRTVAQTTGILRERRVDVVTGFGGYASAPAYLAARRARLPLVLHEANARPGLANRLGARLTPFVGVAFEGTPLPHARTVGMPLRSEIEQLDRAALRPDALEHFGFAPDRPVVVVTGGSSGARSINATIASVRDDLIAAGAQVLHIQGLGGGLVDPGLEHYRLLDYGDRMDLAWAAADLAIGRSGSGTVAELTALGIPAVYIPYPVGNGEQRFNAAGVVAAGGGILVDDADFTPDRVRREVIPLLADPAGLAAMGERAATVGVRDGAHRTARLVLDALATGRTHTGTRSRPAADDRGEARP